jgi:hypothetical protein
VRCTTGERPLIEGSLACSTKKLNIFTCQCSIDGLLKRESSPKQRISLPCHPPTQETQDLLCPRDNAYSTRTVHIAGFPVPQKDNAWFYKHISHPMIHMHCFHERPFVLHTSARMTVGPCMRVDNSASPYAKMASRNSLLFGVKCRSSKRVSARRLTLDNPGTSITPTVSHGSPA